MKTKTKESLEINDINYQRNGISGAGFYTLDVILHQEHKTNHLIITLDPETPEQTRAVTLGDIHEGWRGDYIFNTVLKELNVKEDRLTNDKFYAAVEKMLS